MPIEENDKYISIRVNDPDLFIEESFRFITLSEEQGIFAISGKLKTGGPDGSMKIQAYRFLKEKDWDIEKSNKWVSDHKDKNRSVIEGSVRSFETVIRMNFDDPHRTKLMGLAIPYNKISDAPLPESPQIKEKIAIGAFKLSVADDDIKLLWQHNVQYVLGRKRAGTLTLTENDDGVFFENVPPDAGWARDLQVSIKRQDISYMSFKFGATVHYERMTGGTYLQVVDEGRLDEISVVTDPVYLSTSVYSRSAEGILSVNSKPVELIDPATGISSPDPQILNFDDSEVWKRFKKAIATNENK